MFEVQEKKLKMIEKGWFPESLRNGVRFRQVTFQTLLKCPFLHIFHLKVVICMCRSRLETCESALERYAALLFGKTISSFLQFFFCQIFPWFCSKRRFFW